MSGLAESEAINKKVLMLREATESGVAMFPVYFFLFS
jgi:hypothetical protein